MPRISVEIGGAHVHCSPAQLRGVLADLGISTTGEVGNGLLSHAVIAAKECLEASSVMDLQGSACRSFGTTLRSAPMRAYLKNAQLKGTPLLSILNWISAAADAQRHLTVATIEQATSLHKQLMDDYADLSQPPLPPPLGHRGMYETSTEASFCANDAADDGLEDPFHAWFAGETPSEPTHCTEQSVTTPAALANASNIVNDADTDTSTLANDASTLVNDADAVASTHVKGAITTQASLADGSIPDYDAVAQASTLANDAVDLAVNLVNDAVDAKAHTTPTVLAVNLVNYAVDDASTLTLADDSNLAALAASSTLDNEAASTLVNDADASTPSDCPVIAVFTPLSALNSLKHHSTQAALAVGSTFVNEAACTLDNDAANTKAALVFSEAAFSTCSTLDHYRQHNATKWAMHANLIKNIILGKQPLSQRPKNKAETNMYRRLWLDGDEDTHECLLFACLGPELKQLMAQTQLMAHMLHTPPD